MQTFIQSSGQWQVIYGSLIYLFDQNWKDIKMIKQKFTSVSVSWFILPMS